MSALIRRIFSGNNLFMTNVGVSFALSGLGDVIEQKLEKRNKVCLVWQHFQLNII